MLISSAFAAGTVAGLPAGDSSTSQAFMLNMVLIVVLVGLFYLVVIVPQKKRIRRHSEMLGGLRKGDRIITAGGLLGTVDRVKDGDDEIGIDLGNGVKVTALRSTVQPRVNEADKVTDVK